MHRLGRKGEHRAPAGRLSGDRCAGSMDALHRKILRSATGPARGTSRARRSQARRRRRRFAPAYAATDGGAIAAQPASGPASFADIVDRVEPAVVSVKVKISDSDRWRRFRRPSRIFRRDSPFYRFFRHFGLPDDGDAAPRRHSTLAQGSGFFVSSDGYIVTNNHVVDHASEVTITLANGSTMPAKVIGVDKKTDLALLKAQGDDFAFVTFASKGPRVGDWVIAVGNPFGLGGTVTAGIVSARGRDIGAGPYDDFLQIDAPVNHGNSGGPTFNAQGEVVGVNTAIFSPSGGSVGIGFAIAGERRQERGRAAQGERRRHPRLDRRADSGGVAGHRRQPRAEERGRRPGVRRREEFACRGGGREERGRHHRLRRARRSRTHTSSPGGSPRRGRKRRVSLALIRNGAPMAVEVTLGTMPPEKAAKDEAEPEGRSDDASELARLGLDAAPGSRRRRSRRGGRRSRQSRRGRGPEGAAT